MNNFLESNLLSNITLISLLIGLIMYFNKDLKSNLKELRSDFRHLNDKIDKHGYKLSEIDKKYELLKKDISNYQERINEIKKIDQEAKDMATKMLETFDDFKKIMKNTTNNNKKT